MRLSVIIPCHNDASTIGEAIGSVLAQSEAVFEIIVVDDGSNDASAEVVSAFTDHRIRYIHQANGGAGAARNTGLDQAHGDWIAFLDADDWWTPTRVASAHAALMTNPGIEFMQCNRLYLDEDGSGTTLSAKPEDLVSVTALLSSFRIKTSAVMIARTVVERERLRFPTRQKTCEDYHFFWRAIIGAERLGYVETVDVMIRQNPGSLSRDKSLAYLQRDNIRTLVEVLGWARARPARPEHLTALNCHLHWQLRDHFMMAIKERDARNTIVFIFVALRHEGLRATVHGLLSAVRELFASAPRHAFER